MMNYSVLDDCVQALFEQYVLLSQAQRERLSQFCCSQILAGSSQLPHAVRHLSHFRLGRDWLVHQFRHGLTIPHLLTLYS
jgi:hypothetical protein